MLDWINHNHDAVEALASVSSLVVSLAAVVIAWRSPAIAAQFAKREYARDVRDHTRSLLSWLRREVVSVSSNIKSIRERLSEHKAQPPSEIDWPAFCDAILLRLVPQLDLLYQQSGYVDEAEIAPYLAFARQIREYNEMRFNMQFNERQRAYSDWHGYWEQLDGRLKRLASEAKKLLEQE